VIAGISKELVMPHHLSRRRFLQTTALAGAAGLSANVSFSAEKKLPANERLAVGVIGVAGQGEYDWKEIVKGGAEIVAWCDVDERRTDTARKAFPHAKFYTDFRRLIDQKGLDAVLVATPDHVHAPATLAALRANLHVFCEKPLTHTVHEARLVAETATKQKRVTQMGTQIHGGDNYRRVVELIQSGTIGTVREVHVWVDTSYGSGNRPKETPEVPKGLHWDTWLGPAPKRPYHPTYVPFYWRKWWDFGGGALADMACHHVDLPFWALKLRHPTKISAEGPKPHAETAAPWLIVNYEFPARGKLPPVKLTWYDGGKRPALFAQGKLPKWGNGTLFVGSKGMLIADYDHRKLLPKKEFADFKPPEPSIPNSIGHYKEWVQACKTGGPTTCNFAYAGALTEAVLLGNVAYRLGKPLEWDAKKMKTNEAGAEKFLRKEYRKPWTL
jgi:predicted dehydrogenase